MSTLSRLLLDPTDNTRLLVSRDGTRVVVAGSCDLRYFRATPCRPCTESPLGESIYVATSAVCADGLGFPPLFIYVGGSCYSIDRTTTYRLCEPGYLGTDPCVPMGAQIVSPGQPVECLPDACLDPRCGARWFEGLACDPAYDGPRVFVNCLNGCGFARVGATCFKFGTDLPPQAVLPPGAIVVSDLDASLTSCCQCQSGCNALDIIQPYILGPECRGPLSTISCCCPDLTGACITVSFRRVEDYNYNDPFLNNSNILEYAFSACIDPDTGVLTPPTTIRRYTQINREGTTVTDEEIPTFGPSCPPVTNTTGWTYPCPGTDGDTTTTVSGGWTETCRSSDFDGTVVTVNPSIPLTTTITHRYSASVYNANPGPCAENGCDEIGPAQSPVGPGLLSRTARRPTKRLESGLIVPDNTVRVAPSPRRGGGGCSGCGGGGGI